MPTVDQLQEMSTPLFIGGCIALFAIGVTLFIIWLLEPSSAGLRRRVSRHRKGVRYHKPTHVPVQVQTDVHPYVAFMHAHVHRAHLTLVPETKILPKVEITHASIRR